ncbi:MAG: hypothetical protein KC505_02225 [Myxococcales bacterium]|nr:hypothetical protein [Myxococcales bacterium]USN50585.1 MAG: hypothetical protein H6731_10030 [Myxococcales bacterium]
MLKQIALLSFLVSCTLFSQNKDIFDENFEFDPDFNDDFLEIENGSMDSFSDELANNVLGNSDDIFSLRDVERSERSLSVFSGNEVIARVFHLNVFPQSHFKLWKIEGSVGVPLRFPIYDNISGTLAKMRHKGFVDGLRFVTPRNQDFRSFYDAQRLLRHFELKSDDTYALKLSRSNAYTLAQGELMKDMVTDGLYDQDYMFLSGFLKINKVRFDAVLGPLIKPHIFGFNMRFLPLTSLPLVSFIKEMSVDLSYVSDFFMPLAPQGQHEGAFVLNEERRLLMRKEGNAQAFSNTLKSSYFPLAWMSLTPYFSYSHLFLNQLRGHDAPFGENTYGCGLNLGHQLAFYFSQNKKDSILYFRTEGRFFSANFQPNYFGDHYLLDRQIYSQHKAQPISKAQFVGLDDTDSSWRYGYLVEIAYGLNGIINTKLGFEDGYLLRNHSSQQSLRKFHWISALTIHELMSIYVAYQASTIDQMNELFDFDKSRGLLSLRGQVKLLSYLYFDAWLKHSFGVEDMYKASRLQEGESKETWLSNAHETRSLNFGLGVEFAMTF